MYVLPFQVRAVASAIVDVGVGVDVANGSFMTPNVINTVIRPESPPISVMIAAHPVRIPGIVAQYDLSPRFSFIASSKLYGTSVWQPNVKLPVARKERYASLGAANPVKIKNRHLQPGGEVVVEN
jgi:hypothetical protein